MFSLFDAHTLKLSVFLLQNVESHDGYVQKQALNLQGVSLSWFQCYRFSNVHRQSLKCLMGFQIRILRAGDESRILNGTRGLMLGDPVSRGFREVPGTFYGDREILRTAKGLILVQSIDCEKNSLCQWLYHKILHWLTTTTIICDI